VLSFQNTDHQIKLSISVEGYEFPDSMEDDWCQIKISVNQDGRQYESVDPALEAGELGNIYNWFECLSNANLPEFANLTFTEPCLGFQFLSYKNGVIRIAVELDHELKPKFKLRQFASKQTDWRIVFELEIHDFGTLLNELRKTINEFPVRSKS